ncbi:hypothetical protein HZA98_00940 [Candidatus Woesearchaeota archaeon]|nr:hypothetical protein [Candidatus Woesearchaeota archaeon]
MKKFHTVVLLLLLGLSVFLVSNVSGIIPSQNISRSANAYANESYIATARPNFNVTFVGENQTYLMEVYINGTPRGFAVINDTIIQNLTVNATIVDGVNYTWFINISNGTQSNITGNFFLTIDTVNPSMVVNASTITNNSNLTTGNFTIAFGGASDTNYLNFTVLLVNSSSGAVYNKTVYNGTAVLDVNYVNVPDGNYTVNVTTRDRSNNANRSVSRFVTVDSTPPVVTLSISDSSLIVGDTLTISCRASDVIDTSPSGPTIRVQRPVDTSFTVFAGGTWTDTSQEGTYNVKCDAGDYMGNTALSTGTFSVAAANTGSTSGGGGGGSSGGSSASTGTTATTTPVEVTPVSVESSDSWSSAGSVEYTDVVEGAVYSLSFTTADGATVDHSISVKAVDETAGTVTFVVASAPTEVTLAVGESKEVDLSGDGQSDLKLTLNGITAGVADVSMEKIGVWLEATVSVSTQATEKTSSRMWIWVLVVLVLVVLAVFFFVGRGKTRSTKPARRR